MLILPAAPEGWEKASNRRLKSLYKAVWQDTSSPDPREVLRNVWCWETLIFAVGYGEGAVFAGDAAVAHPNLFAQTVLVNGVPHDYLPAEELSDRWLLPDASADWQHKNREIPTAVWMLGNQDTAQAEAYFSRPGTDLVAVSKGDYGPAPETTAELLRQMNTRIRWKNSPDGTPARIKSQSGASQRLGL